MLQFIFGNKTAAKVLLFLERQRKVHAWSLAQELGIPLNMVQKQLERFEKAGVLHSRLEGRRKLYEWNPHSPFLPEIKLLLQKQAALIDPADGSHLSLVERVIHGEELIREAERLNPHQRPIPFTKSFETYGAYERWKKRQTNPWLV